MKQRNQVQFTQHTVGTDDVRIALGEFLVPAFARAVAPPYRLHLVPAKRKRQVVARHHDKPGKWHGQIVAQGLFRNARCQRFRITGSERISIGFAEVIPVVEDFKNELIAFFPVLPGEGLEALHCRGFDGLKPVSFERLAHHAEHPVSTGHNARTKIPRSFWNGWFAHSVALSLVLTAVLNEGHDGEDGHAEEYVLHANNCFEGTKFGNRWEPTKQQRIFPATKAPFMTHCGTRAPAHGSLQAAMASWLNGMPKALEKDVHSFTTKRRFLPWVSMAPRGQQEQKTGNCSSGKRTNPRRSAASKPTTMESSPWLGRAIHIGSPAEAMNALRSGAEPSCATNGPS